MIVQVDLIQDTVLLLDGDLLVLDAFAARGITRAACDDAVRFYTYRSLVTLPGACIVCGRDLEAVAVPCTSSGGFHAFVGTERGRVPEGHRAEDRSVPVRMLRFEDLCFFVEQDNLFSIEEIAEALSV